MDRTAPVFASSRRQTLFLVLSGIFICNAVLAEIIGVKIFSAENTLGLPSAQIKLLGDYTLDFNLTAGVLIWPVVFVTTDIINEYFGKPGVKRVSYLTVVLIIYMFLVITVVRLLPPADFWLDVNKTDANGLPFNINTAFDTIFRQGLGIIIGSVTAFLIGQLLDMYIFQYLRSLTGKRMIWLRATGSTLVSQFIDSFVVLGIAFYVFGNWDLKLLISVGLVNYAYKFWVAVLATPVLYMAHAIIDKYLAKEAPAKTVAQQKVPSN